MMKVILIFAFLHINFTCGFIGYDCGAAETTVKTFSLLNVENCKIENTSISSTQQYIELLQINDYIETTVSQCKVEIHRTVYYCGMHSHISVVMNGENSFIKDISKEKCALLHDTGVYTVSDSLVLTGIISNSTTTRGIVFAGSIKNDGTCKGTTFSDQFGTWDDVVVQGTIKITLSKHVARIKLSSNTIHLKSGTSCLVDNGNCFDYEDGYSFWKAIPVDNCKFNKYSVLYKGFADKIVDTFSKEDEVVYSLQTEDITFALAAKGKEYVCGFTTLKTEHPKLIIFETDVKTSFATSEKTEASNLNIFNYINSKFVYVEKHIKKQLKHLYIDVMHHKCELEKKTLQNALSFATQAPDEFAYDLMQNEGYMAVAAGEVVHIIKCLPVDVRIKRSEKCFAELQVTRNNITYFLKPRTHILKLTGTEIPCNVILPQYFFINKQWLKILPIPTEAESPKIVKPLTNLTWNYSEIKNLAGAGIYTETDLNELRERIMFPVEKPSLLNEVARELGGYVNDGNTGTIFKLLNDNTLEKIVESTWDKYWYRLSSAGNMFSIILLIGFIIYCIKTVLPIIMQGYALHSVYGWSIHILGALFSSVAHFLIHLSTTSGNKSSNYNKNNSNNIRNNENNNTNNQANVFEIKPSTNNPFINF